MLAHFKDLFCIVDEKSTTSLGSSWTKSWSMRGQFLGYCFAAQNYGLPISTALIRGIAFQVKEIQHAQVIEQYPQWQIDRWWKCANRKVRRLVDTWIDACEELHIQSGSADTVMITEHDSFPEFAAQWEHSYGNACDSYGDCMFRDSLCTTQHPEDWLSEYDIRRWDPLAKDPCVPILQQGNM